MALAYGCTIISRTCVSRLASSREAPVPKAVASQRGCAAELSFRPAPPPRSPRHALPLFGKLTWSKADFSAFVVDLGLCASDHLLGWGWVEFEATNESGLDLACVLGFGRIWELWLGRIASMGDAGLLNASMLLDNRGRGEGNVDELPC